jgi:branched-chain amino acid transport system permease protein
MAGQALPQDTVQRTSRPAWLQTLLDNWVYIVILALLILLPHIIGWLTGSSPFGVQRGARTIMSGASAYWQAVLIEVFALAILVMSYNLMFGFTGVISFGHALFFGLGGYSVGMMLQYTSIEPNLALLLGMVITLVFSAVIGLLIGLMTLRLRGVYFAIFTLAVAEMFWIFFWRWDFTNGEDGFTIANMPAWIDPTQSRLNLYYFGLILFVLCFVFIRRLIHSPTGAVFQAIRENEERAQAIGYHTLRFKLLSITAAGMMAGMAGVLQGLLNKKLGPELFGVMHTVDALLMTIIGGAGTFAGPVIGASSLHLADTIFRDARVTVGGLVINIGDSWLMIMGFIFVVVVLIFPHGIVGTWMKLTARLGKLRRARAGHDPAQIAQQQPGEVSSEA